MFRIINRLLVLAGENAGKIKLAFVFSIMEAIFAQVPIIAVLWILVKIVAGSVVIEDAWLVGIAVTASVVLRALAKRLVDGWQSGAGYEIFARERMRIGDRLKRLPMGYFSAGNIGNITAVVTSDLVFVEEHSMATLSHIIRGYLNTLIGVGLLTVLDYRIGLISLVTLLLAVAALNKIQTVVKRQAVVRQETQSRLVGAVLEYIKGIAVIKAFNLTGDRAEKIKREFKAYRDAMIQFEEKFIPPSLYFDHCFTLGIGFTVLASAYFAFAQTMDLSLALMLLIFIFQFYLPFKALGILSVKVRIIEAALNRYEAIQNEAIIDEKGKDIMLSQFTIEFDDVTFAYDREQILKQVSFTVPERSMTALVGRSGSGKTTIASLIARFWDVQAGAVKIGGVNVREMTCDSLLKHISMVFQHVYLFNDTILNNIRFGRPDATREEVVIACKKACCHDFIMELEHGYDTVVGEGGSSLSGGEKQRLSIARAILKDAPIILLDEATASMDPENERLIQQAISALVKDKTLVVIAHRLATIKDADQILVIDEGRIVQSGGHEELIEAKGQYYDFWQRRIKAGSWKISKGS
ncbi:ABC transporter ATP-binding protein [Sporomusa sphaeroides]|uniref:Lipid A export ATP-binding/permease protein MsbA n=1 Tax=Sporomusa sphaeroides DSM 2875 TaxID=1337886 RepID=A0ABM9W4T7_9FIRM|nr:ABC transporter ATP-binding protein [Sporomusa sphaeroides]OLS57271.1 lipid A export ATP-binding/permease protein MsbA [Sporomusa sphaeroides DSM 2875]CVK20173.1 Lipid A export ATP-binding/permease protein MsbA [Sporomusa sphaeroides DSM 2875]